MGEKLNAKEKTVGSYLAHNTSADLLYIPYSQRPYEWGKKQIERLFKDIILVNEGKADEHIINFITIYKDDEQSYIYDGQQRTVTLAILICLIGNELEKREQEQGSKLKSEYIIEKKLFSANEEIKINFYDNKTNRFFKDYVINNNEYDKKNKIIDEELKKIKYAYDLLKEKLDEYIDNNNIVDNEIPVFLLQLAETIVKKIWAIVMETESESIAQQMFETLNNSGKQLEDFYVTKNHCVQSIGEEETKLRWEIIEDNLNNLNKKQFLTQFASVFNGKTESKNAKDALVNIGKLEGENNIVETLDQMAKASKCFQFLNIPMEGLYEYKIINDKINSSLNRSATALKILKNKQGIPIVLAMYIKDYSEEDIDTVLKLILNLHIRNITICNDAPNTLEQFYPTVAQEIINFNLDINTIKSKIEEKIKSNANVCLAINNTKHFNNENQIARYILKEIYNKENSDEININPDTDKVNLEHILPKTPTEYWKKIFDDEYDNYLHKLGNLTLMNGPKNKSIQNKPFDEKKEVYKKSKIPQTKDIDEYDKWDKDAVNERTNKLAELFIDIWKKNI